MRVSILIPAFNSATVLDRAVATAQGQQFDGELEIVICDDGSTDETLELAKAMARTDNRIRVHTNGHNKGVSATRNELIEKSTGEWIAFLDADDVFLPDKIARCLAFASATGADAVLHGLSYLSKSGRVRGSVGRADFLQASLLRRSVIGEERFDTDLLVGEDGDLFSRIRQRTTVHFLPEKLTALSLNAGSLTDKHWKDKRIVELWQSRHPGRKSSDAAAYVAFFNSLSKMERIKLERVWRSQKLGRMSAVHAFNASYIKASIFAVASLLLDYRYLRSRLRPR